MTRFVVFAVTLAIAVAAFASVARAEPLVVHAERCTSLDAAALSAAVDRELALAPGGQDATQPIAVDITCPDKIHARVSIAFAPTAAPADDARSRDLDLSEEPPPLRIKLVALAIAELVDELRAESAAPLPAVAPATIDIDDAPSSVRVRGADGLPSPRATVRGGLRMIAGGPPMPTLSAEIDARWFRLGLVTAAAVGDDHRTLGMPYFVGVTASRRLLCSHGRTAMCMIARAEAGLEGESVGADYDNYYMGHTVYATYADLAVGFEARRRFAGWNWVAGIDVGGGDGLVMENKYLERLDGPFAVTTLGASW